MPRTTHLVISHAHAAGPRCTEALQALQLPQLQALLGQMQVQPRESTEAGALSGADERAAAHALGLPVKDGLLPWAAREAQALQLPLAGSSAWARITPCHWEIATGHVRMPDPATLALQEAESRALMDAMQPWFAEDGVQLHWVAPLHWLAQGEALRELPTAALSVASGEAVDAWMPASRVLRRLQNEMQMLLYTHPVNDARLAKRQLAVNSFWISGTGSLPATWQEPEGVVWDQSLAASAQADDGAAWAQAWQELDRTLLVGLRQSAQTSPVQLTLCSAEGSLPLRSSPPHFWQRLRARLSPPDARSVLSRL